MSLMLVTGNQYFDVAGTALIGLLLVAGRHRPRDRDQEPAARRVGQRPRRSTGSGGALTAPTGVDRVIHLKTLHLGPEELLVAVKVGVRATDSAADVAAAIDAAERRVRAAEPTAHVDLPRAGHLPRGLQRRAEAALPAGH